MNFTREPIIETVITPKEGYKLIVRNSKGGDQEEYVVDAVEVVSFGHALFFRSSEKSKSFLVPVSDFEVVEAKETRVVLKNVSFERTIKIGAGWEPKAAKPVEVEQEAAEVEQKLEKKRERKRHRRRRGGAEEEKKETEPSTAAEEGMDKGEEPSAVAAAPPIAPPVMAKLIPPPTRLISEKMFKEKEAIVGEADAAAPEAKEKPHRKRGAFQEEKGAVSEEPSSGPEELRDDKPTVEWDEMSRSSIPQEAEPVTNAPFARVEKKGLSSIFGKIW